MSSDTNPLIDVDMIPSLTLAHHIQRTYQNMIVRYIQTGITRDEILLVVARYLFNREQLCDKSCKNNEEIHFHDLHDWNDPTEKDALLKFWRKLQSDKATVYVDELAQFAQEMITKMSSVFTTQSDKTREFLQTLTSDKDSTEFMQMLLTEHKEIETTFPFQCSVICMLLDMHGMTPEERTKTNWFEQFFTYFIDDYDDEESDDSDEESDDDSDEEDTKEDEDTKK